MRVIVSAGGTGGHIYPALAIIDELKKREKNLSVLYIGTHNRMEKDIVPQRGIAYESIEIYGFTKDIKRDIKNIFLLNKAQKKCLKLMKEFKPDVVIGVGGYVTYPVIKAAKKLNIKTFIHEQNSRPGKVNYLLSRYASLVGVTFKSSIDYFKRPNNIVYTGHPSLDTACNAKKVSKLSLGVDPTKKLVVFVAGSLGSSSLNEKMLDFLNSDLHKSYEILYICGSAVNQDEFAKKVKKASNIHFVPYVSNLPGIIASCDVVISRAGAGSLFEIIALEKPSIIIPSPNVANNHQYFNALELKENGAIELLEEKNITKEKLSETINELLNNQEKIASLKKNMAKYKKIEPLDTIYTLIKALTNKEK
jgi:UDP-N-acetylglucosamine--N-acetylmuramyl-(pentapeptide) pyrophosphoryl-undecaprenol N-acetylglucosamine transferase